MQSGNVGNLLRRVPLSDGTMQNGRSCFRSLDDEHYGKLCPNSKICGKNGCQEIHHRLLHQHNRRTEPSSGNAKDHTAPKLSTQAKENHVQIGVHSRKIQLLLSRREGAATPTANYHDDTEQLQGRLHSSPNCTNHFKKW